MFRWFVLAVLLGCLSISTDYRRQARLEAGTIPRHRESSLLMAGGAVVGLLLFLSVVTSVMNPRWIAWASFAPPIWFRWLGVFVGLVTVPATYWVFISLGRNVSQTILTKDQRQLVTAGPYRWIRHPLSTTDIALFLGIGVMAASWFTLLFALTAVAAVHLVVIPAEERKLLAKFSDRCRAHMVWTDGTHCIGRGEPPRSNGRGGSVT